MDDKSQSPSASLHIINRALFYEAVKSQDICLLKSLLDSGEDPNSTEFGGDSVLHHAVRTENINIVQLLLDRGANPNYTNRGGHSALHFAVCQENSCIVAVLLAHAANPNITNSRGDSAIHYAIVTENIDILNILLDNGADPSLQNLHGNSPLHKAVNIKNSARFDVNSRESYYPNVSLSIVKALLKAGADVGSTDDNGSTALHLTRSKDIALCLLEGGAPKDARDNEGRTPLHLSVRKRIDGFDSIVEPLLFAGANFDIPDNKGKTVMEICKYDTYAHAVDETVAKFKALKIKKNIACRFGDVNFDIDSGFLHFTSLNEELDIIKGKIVEGVRLYDVLKYSLNNLKFLNNAKFRSSIEEDDFKLKFPQFYLLIRMSVWEAEMLKALVDELSVDLTKLKSASVPSIPQEVWRVIITELEDQDLKNLKRALESKE